jgi:hypothetical protein
MNEIRDDRPPGKLESTPPVRKSKRRYEKPNFQHERVFETMALACGKIGPTSFSCTHNRKSS